MATFVLVDGAWHGGWCWQRLTPLLRAAGHEVYTPTLTGLGERAHLLSPAIDLDTHAQDVLGMLECEQLWEVILVGHSYGGMVITAVAEQAAERLTHLVYLDAFVPQDGQCLLDFLPPQARAQTLARARAEGEGWRLPAQQEQQPFGVTDPADADWLRGKLSAHPVKTFEQPIQLTNSLGSFCQSGFRSAAKAAIRNWIGWYNQERPHQALAYRSPEQFSHQHVATAA